MEIKTLKDIKDSLKDIPDELLDNLWFGLGEDCEEEISMLAPEGDGMFDYPQVWDVVDKKYSKLYFINKLIKNIAKAQAILSKEDKESEKLNDRLWDDGDQMTSDFFDKKK